MKSRDHTIIFEIDQNNVNYQVPNQLKNHFKQDVDAQKEPMPHESLNDWMKWTIIISMNIKQVDSECYLEDQKDSFKENCKYGVQNLGINFLWFSLWWFKSWNFDSCKEEKPANYHLSNIQHDRHSVISWESKNILFMIFILSVFFRSKFKNKWANRYWTCSCDYQRVKESRSSK